MEGGGLKFGGKNLPCRAQSPSSSSSSSLKEGGGNLNFSTRFPLLEIACAKQPSCSKCADPRGRVRCLSPICRTGNGEKLSCSQAERGQAIKSAVASFPSISCATSWRRSRYSVPHPALNLEKEDQRSGSDAKHISRLKVPRFPSLI